MISERAPIRKSRALLERSRSLKVNSANIQVQEFTYKYLRRRVDGEEVIGDDVAAIELHQVEDLGELEGEPLSLDQEVAWGWGAQRGRANFHNVCEVPDGGVLGSVKNT